MKWAGFTLLELLIAVTVMAVLFSIAIPYYQSYWLESRRSEAYELLSYHAQRLEQYYTAHDTYIGYTPDSGSGDDYRFHIDVNANAYVVTATALGDQADDQENGIACTPMTWTQDGVRSPAACWR